MSPELLVPVFLEEWLLFQCCFQNGGFGRHHVDRQGSGWLNQAPGEGRCLREGCQRVTDGRRGGRGEMWRLRQAKQPHMSILRGVVSFPASAKCRQGALGSRASLRGPGLGWRLPPRRTKEISHHWRSQAVIMQPSPERCAYAGKHLRCLSQSSDRNS